MVKKKRIFFSHAHSVVINLFIGNLKGVSTHAKVHLIICEYLFVEG